MLGPRTSIIWSLDLTSEQRGKIDKLIEKLQHDSWATMGTIMGDSGVLRDLYHADKRDSVAIDKTYQRIFDLKRQMIKAALDTENEIEDLLTPDQLKAFQNRLHQAPLPYPGQ
jgi:Spy/CpxP family protein refolding chaperone